MITLLGNVVYGFYHEHGVLKRLIFVNFETIEMWTHDLNGGTIFSRAFKSARPLI